MYEKYNLHNVQKHVLDVVEKLFSFSYHNFGLHFEEYPIIKISLKSGNSCFYMNEKGRNVIEVGCLESNSDSMYREYEFIKFDEVIGDFCTLVEMADGAYICDWKKYLSALICHEFAHLVEWAIGDRIKIPKNYNYHSPDLMDDKSQVEYHDAKWQYIYSIFRENFVNDDIDS